jgi:hypothetical protein
MLSEKATHDMTVGKTNHLSLKEFISVAIATS